MRRRRYLALLGTATVGGLAGCSGGSGGGDSTTSTDAGTETGTQTPTPTETTGGESTTATTTRTETETRTPTRTETETPSATQSTTQTTIGESSNGTTDEGTGGSGGEMRTVEVGPGGQYVFEPGTQSPLEIPIGTTVEWVWRSDTHNIVVGDQPSGANWEGTPGGAGAVYDTGYTYTHTFETDGEYHYWCSPHQSLGMVADIVVTGGR